MEGVVDVVLQEGAEHRVVGVDSKLPLVEASEAEVDSGGLHVERSEDQPEVHLGVDLEAMREVLSVVLPEASAAMPEEEAASEEALPDP